MKVIPKYKVIGPYNNDMITHNIETIKLVQQYNWI